MESLDILRKLVSFNTVADAENQALTGWLADFLRQAGFEASFFGQGSRRGVIARRGGAPGLSFVGHTDTVPASANWTMPPFEITEKEGFLYGLGVCDTKGGVAALLAAVSDIDWRESRKGIELLFTYDEEGDLSGIQDFLRADSLRADRAVIIEPTDLVPVMANKGGIFFKAEFVGKEAHSSEPEKGVNAILLAAGFIDRLEEIFQKAKGSGLGDPAFKTGLTMNISTISGGDADNKVPGRCSLGFGFRTTSAAEEEMIKEAVAAAVKDFSGSSALSLCLPAAVNKQEDFVSFCEQASGRKRQTADYATEGCFLPGKDFVVLGPGPVTAHRADEHIRKEGYLELIQIYKRIIQEYCL